jgi:uncharacterized BrkB/YihY/UPF0761 family membrane protein
MSWDSDDDPFPTHYETRTRRLPCTGDAIASVSLLLLLLLLGALLSFVVVLEQMGVAACSGNVDACDFTLLSVTTWITPAIALASVVLTIFVLSRRSKNSRSTWWVPVLGMAFTLLGFVIASILVSTAIQGGTG